MEYASIERQIHVEAAPGVVYDVVSTPEQMAQWWPDEAAFTTTPGENGSITFHGHGDNGGPAVVALTVVVADPPKTFTFRWTHDPGEEAVTGNSLLVTFDLVPQGTGTLVTMTETGFREMGWEEAKVAAVHADHESGWNQFIPRLGSYVAGLVSQS